MKTLIIKRTLKPLLVFCSLLFLMSCDDTKKENSDAAEQDVPMIEAASQEYADIVLNVLDHMSNFDHDAYGALMEDDITWYWPDGNSETRHTIKGKEALIAWWKNWKETTGGTLNFANNTFLPIKSNTPSNYYKLVGTGVLAYTDLTISIGDKSTSVRQHMVFMFNDEKKISHCFLYYDRTGIIELTNVVFGETE